jgi:aminoglycoside phosphotransferase (APT) family kinase protein
MEEPILSALQDLAAELGGEGQRIEGLERLSGGASLQTWAFRLGDRAMILRRRPVPLAEGDARSVTLATEAALIRAAADAGAPVAPLIHVSNPASPLGEAHITARIEGETLGRRIVTDPRFDAIRPHLARQCGEVLGRIHAAKSPKGLSEVDALAELARYETVYRQSGARRPVLELAFRHLTNHAPTPVPAVQLHGDFRNGNLMISPTDGLVAVLDWELSHRGDPAEDLGWICVNSWRFGRPDRPVGGFGVYEDLLAGYEAASGRTVSLERLLYWQALGSLKWGVMCLMMYASYASGTEASVERPMIGRRVSETEIDLLHILETLS